MYRVLCDGLPIYDLRDENLVLIDPKLDLEVNKAGAFSFKMPPQHPQYELPQKMLSCIQVFQDEEEVFNGRITEFSSVAFFIDSFSSCFIELYANHQSKPSTFTFFPLSIRVVFQSCKGVLIQKGVLTSKSIILGNTPSIVSLISPILLVFTPLALHKALLIISNSEAAKTIICLKISEYTFPCTSSLIPSYSCKPCCCKSEKMYL